MVPAFCRAKEQQQQRQRDVSSHSQPPSSPQQALPTPVMVDLHRKLCDGSAGAVVLGAYGGAPAVVKLLGPDDYGLAQYEAELHMYHLLEPLQGQVVPRLLGAGYLDFGVHFLATSTIDGTPLSSLPHVTDAVASGALLALQRIRDVLPGFLHGDIRLENVLVLSTHGGEGGGGGDGEADAACMFVDFACSQVGGSMAEQREEEKRLKRLTGDQGFSGWVDSCTQFMHLSCIRLILVYFVWILDLDVRFVLYIFMLRLHLFIKVSIIK